MQNFHTESPFFNIWYDVSGSVILLIFKQLFSSLLIIMHWQHQPLNAAAIFYFDILLVMVGQKKKSKWRWNMPAQHAVRQQLIVKGECRTPELQTSYHALWWPSSELLLRELTTSPRLFFPLLILPEGANSSLHSLPLTAFKGFPQSVSSFQY